MIAVLTGDLVNSTHMPRHIYDNVIKDLQSLLHNANSEYKALGEIYRGDGFQIQYPTPEHALKSTLLIKLALHLSDYSNKPIQCTLSLAYGDYERYDDSPNTSSGAVFITSGRELDKTQRGDLSLHFPIMDVENNNDNTLLLTQFFNHILNRLTKSQAQLLYQYIENDFAEHKKMADITGTSRQNISNRLSNIGADLIKDYMSVINQKVIKINKLK